VAWPTTPRRWLCTGSTTLFYAIQTDPSKAREEELAPGGTLVQGGQQIGQAFGRELTLARSIVRLAA
jgi:hypothetical protein